MDNIELFNDDCRNKLKELIEQKVFADLVITSPPYDNLRSYNGEIEWNFEIFKDVANLLYSILKNGGVLVWVVGDATINGSETGTSFKQALYFKDIGFYIHDTMIYHKINPIPQNHNRYEQSFEYIFVLTKGKPKTFNPILEETKNSGKIFNWGDRKTKMDDKQCRRDRNDEMLTVKKTKIKQNIFSYSVGGERTGHPAVFPEKLAYDQLITWSNEGDLVIDPFMGSGTTGKVCLENNRKFIGIEKVKEYFNISLKRIGG